ncbi:MAG: GNAT family N-acetyltransferase [Kofleriaceae bacterium]
MTSYQVRALRRDDFVALRELERDIFGAAEEDLLCAHYLRLCCEVFADTCFLALRDEHPVGYLLGFVRRRRAHCGTPAVRPEHQRRRATGMLIGAFVEAVVDQVDECWFTVKGDNVAARTLHAFLGAREVERRRDYYGIGEDRIVSCVDRKDFDRLRERYHRLRGAAGEPVMERPSPSVAA